MNSLLHRTVYVQPKLIQRCLPFISALQQHHPDGAFYLVEDPAKSKRTTIIGMFVLRPGWKRWGVKPASATFSMQDMFGNLDWVYNVKGADGGKFIANNNGVDAYRLALQYGLSDAVIIGSNVVSNEGVTSCAVGGYMWQPYEVCKWKHLHSADPALIQKIEGQRCEWQQLGLLSSRKYPAQIVVTWNGEKKDTSPDFLAGRIFHETLPTGEPMETYIITSEVGSHNIRKRAKQFGLEQRIEDMLIVLPPTTDIHHTERPITGSHAVPGARMDLSVVPKLLYDKFDIRIANHDGGQGVLLAFARAGALSQLNLTLCKHKSVSDLLLESPVHKLKYQLTEPSVFSAEIDKQFQYFFRNRPKEHSSGAEVVECGISCCERGLPVNLPVVSAIQDECGDVVVVTLKMDKKFDFHVDST